MGYFWLRASELHWLKQYRQSIKVCEEGLLLYPDSVPLKILLGTILLDVNEEERARNLFIALLECTDITNEQRVILLNNTAYTNVLMNRKDLLAEADRYSEQAYRNAPWSLAIQGTRGAVLVEIGKIEEGLTLLRKAFNEHTEEKMKAIGAAHIAIGEKQRGNREEAIRYYNTAYKLDPNIPILNRLKEELEM